MVTDGQASPFSHKHFGLTMYCPGFTVTSLHTSLALQAGNWKKLLLGCSNSYMNVDIPCELKLSLITVEQGKTK